MTAFRNRATPSEITMPSGNRAGLLGKAAPSIFVRAVVDRISSARNSGLPHAEPFTFLSIRVVLTLAMLVPVALLFVRRWPGASRSAHSMVTGVLVHGVYLGGVFFAISRGMPAGVAALVVALQPLATAFAARADAGRKAAAAAIGGAGRGLVRRCAGRRATAARRRRCQRHHAGDAGFHLCGGIGISLGTVYQKRFVTGLDLRLATVAQYVGALVPFLLLSFLTETRQVEWTGEFVFALAWLVLVLSIGAVGLLMLLIRTNTASGTASLFYLVPAVTAVIAWFLFGEKLTPIQLLGMAVVMGAVALATRAPEKIRARNVKPGSLTMMPCRAVKPLRKPGPVSVTKCLLAVMRP